MKVYSNPSLIQQQHNHQDLRSSISKRLVLMNKDIEHAQHVNSMYNSPQKISSNTGLDTVKPQYA